MKLYKDTVGTIIEAETLVDLSTATKVSILVKYPLGDRVEWIGTANGTLVEYTTSGNDLSQSGEYVAQSYVELPNWKGPGDSFKFTVYDLYT